MSMSAGQWFDNLLAAPFPVWAARRARARLAFDAARVFASTYKAAEKSRLNANQTAKNKSADQALVADYWTLLARSRQAMRDDWAARAIQRAFVRHVIGTGIVPRANVRDLVTDAPRRDLNQWQNWWFARWARTPAWCDQERKRSFIGLQRLAAREYVAAGQAFAILNYAPRPDMVGLTVQLLEPEQLATSLSRNSENGNEIRAGIEIDQFGAPVAYWFYTQGHPYELNYGSLRSTVPVRVEAKRVLHWLDQQRIRQTLGETRLAPVLNELWHTRMYGQYTLLRAQMEACIGAEEYTEVGADADDMKGLLGSTTDPTAGDKDARGNVQYIFEPGMILRPPPGKRLNFIAPETPANQHVPYVQSQIKKIAAGAGTDYPSLSRDYSGNTFAGQRQGMIEGWAESDPEQIEFTDAFARPIWELFQTCAILEGRYDAPDFKRSPEDRAAHLEAIFRTPAKPWIDPANQAAAAKIALEQRLTNRERLLAELGDDRDELFYGIRDEQALAKELGIRLPETEAQAASGFQPGQSQPSLAPGNGNGTPAVPDYAPEEPDHVPAE